MNSKILQYHQDLKTGKISLTTTLTQIKTALANHAHANAIINDCYASAQIAIDQFQPSSSLLNGVFFSLKDNIVTTDQVTTGGSLFLKNYTSPFEATVAQKLKAAGAINVAKANLDEFGLGGSGTFSAYGPVHLYNHPEYLMGGSSSGSAYLVAAGIVPFSIGTDTGDSVRKPASFGGIVGFKPSYGLISRFGVYPFCPSLDTVGILSQTVIDAAIVLDVIAGQDQHDTTTWTDSCTNYLITTQQPITKKIRIGILKNMFDYEEQPNSAQTHFDTTKTEFLKLVQELESRSEIEIVWTSFDDQILKVISSLYLIIAYAEAASCYANLTGSTFGLGLAKNNFFTAITDNRSCFGQEFKKRMAIGAYALSAKNYFSTYLQSKKVREIISDLLEEKWNECDAILSLGAFGTSYKIAELNAGINPPKNMIDSILQIANFEGLPSITIPWIKIKGLSVGLNLFTKEKQDGQLLNLAYWISEWISIKEVE
ncbi:aspartyl-tRNA(Asn)/glutamyl-tRNA(Gln) amidotransferase subunit A [Mycoplasmoides fastidiosum]|uniref:Aspartyl-tRNA(Asn)/glutamyl-tRNA(Gln) amidotransferase subunit A n=1 Tax=Mycoplasmoides fastidiosum TaxID=92758 RepID=A0ABU0LZE2_9BACT|nr:amidase family protein [Mycoplasmoides fastidiosum]MDQ0514073.1 aspartyl-tRNA(Asn)/glutamyl-tRNA(Gln) amidotransferase subunit A [Mycoplasmoides fastidiosum]UUD37517.1 amidase family protein [Mycoplasmoides fastidiosum]